MAYRLYGLQIKDKLIVRFSPGRKIVHFLLEYHPNIFSLKIKKAKTIVSLHQPESFMQELLASPRKRLRRRTEKFLSSLKYADSVVLLGKRYLGYYARFVPFEKFSVILHGVDTNYFRPSATRNNQSKILTVGSWLRDYDLWMRVVNLVLRRFPFAKFKVIASQTQIKQLKTEISTNVIGYNHQIETAANLTDEELLKEYHESNILFLPLKDALANNALLEGMSCGLPIVLSDVGAVREYIGDSNCAYMVDNKRPEEFADRIMQLLESPDDRAEMGKRARARAEQLDWKLIAKEYEALYARIAQE
ncbi:MAG TPA: glycosyltransferase family 4 protein [Puia sp.]|nr:glycosyltransferase family 4 protein [Puia sp.]